VAIRGALLRAVGEAYEARARGGKLWRGGSCVSGAPSLGTVLPRGGTPAAVELVEELEPIAEVELEIEPEVALPARDGGAPVVLVVDDEPEIRRLVQRMLQSKGYAVEVAQDGAEALEKADRLVPDLVLLDAMLPKVHGFEACRRLRSSARTRHVPVVMMTAIYRGWRFAQDARDTYGAVDYVEKPFRLDDLLHRVEEALLAAPAAAPAARLAERGRDPNLARGKDLLALGKLPDAVVALSEAVRASPHSADAHFQLGRALRGAGDAFGAMTALERAAELRPDHLACLRALAAVYEETGFRRKAAEMLERALPAAPDETARVAIRRDLGRLTA
jgi:CheY-like chemotaxis protein